MNDVSPIDRAPVRALIALAALPIIFAACAASSNPGWTYAPLPATPTPGASASGSPGASGSPAASGSPTASGSPAASGSPTTSGSPATGNVIEIEENSALQILQNGAPVTELHFTVGQTYEFHVTNTAGFDHNFYLGPPDRLQANDVTDLPGVPTNQSGMQMFTWTATADAQGWEFACTVPGHYTNMHGAVILDQ